MTKPLARPFCQIADSEDHERIQIQNEHGFVIRDRFPVTDGHTLVIPKRHIQSFFDLTDVEHTSLLTLLDRAKAQLDVEFSPAAGQTVPHVHIHLIPRYEVEGVDPRGGVRWVVPGKADYWSGL